LADIIIMKFLLPLLLVSMIRTGGDDDYYSDEHDHQSDDYQSDEHDHHNHVKSAKGDQWVKDKKTLSRAVGYSEGHGQSNVFAGPHTSNSSANGNKGSGSKTGFKNNSNEARNNWENYEDSNGRGK